LLVTQRAVHALTPAIRCGKRLASSAATIQLSVVMCARRAITKSSPALSLRDLNRALLARQFLLARENISVLEAVRRLVALQAQMPAPPYVGLWTRLQQFERGELASLLDARRVVRAPLLRGTLHLVAAEDYLRLRPTLRTLFEHALDGMPANRMRGIDPAALAAEAAPFLRAAPRTQDEVRTFLTAQHPKLDERMMGHAVRMQLPLVQIPGPGAWGFPAAPQFALADAWIGRPLVKKADGPELVRRYLAAFGPATARDVQVWSGAAKELLAETIAEIRDELVAFEDEKGRELFDLPNAPRPAEDTTAPPRFLPEFDNVLLSHVDRSRIVPEKFRKGVFLPGLRVAPTFLIDGFVHGSWSVERQKQNATLVLQPFATVPRSERAGLVAEGERLVRFVAADAEKHLVRFAK
jgi:hypothetical protein